MNAAALAAAHGHVAAAAAQEARRRQAADAAARANEHALREDAAHYVDALLQHRKKLEQHVHRPESLLLGLLSVFLLINVDSHTRDDVLTLTTLRVAAHLLRPGLVLDAYTLSLLAALFQALGLSYELLRRLTDKSARLVATERSGEWLLVDHVYTVFLEDQGVNHLAEPLGGVIKLQTLQHAELSRLTATLRALAATLGAAGPGPAQPRARFFWALLAFVNACARSAFHENLAQDLFQELQELAAGHLVPPAERAAQLTALEALTEARAQLLAPPLDELADDAHERRDYRQRAFHLHRDAWLDAQAAAYYAVLRRLVLWQLQLLTFVRYLDTGRAARLAFLLAAPDFTPAHVSLFWLAELHLALASLGLDLPRLAAALALLAPEQAEPPLAYLMAHGQARRDLAAFLELRRALLASLHGPGPRDAALERCVELLHAVAPPPGLETGLFVAAALALLEPLRHPPAEHPASPRPAEHPASPRPAERPASPRPATPGVLGEHADAYRQEASRAVARAHPAVPAAADRAAAEDRLAALLAELATWPAPAPRTPRSPAAGPRPTTPAAVLAASPLADKHQ